MTDVPQRTRNTARATLIASAIDHLSTYGPVGVQPQDICRELGISKALVNYHFGTREGLIAEAMVQAYEQYVEMLSDAATAAGPDPVDRLMARIDQQIEWTAAHSGLAAALGFPKAALGRSSLEAELEQRLAQAGARNFENLRRLVQDARAQLVGAEVADDDENANTAAVIGWLTLGASVGSNHVPMRQTADLPSARAHMRTMITEMLARR